MPSEFAPLLVPSLAAFSQRDGKGVNFEFTCEMSETLLERLRNNQLDVAVAMTAEGGADDALASWRMPMSWVSAPGYRLPSHGPVHLITTPEGSLYHSVASAALQRAGRPFEIVCKSANFDVLRSAVDSGYGVSAFVTGLAPKSAQVVPSTLIAALPDVTLGLFARESAASASARPLVESMIDLLSASLVVDQAA